MTRPLSFFVALALLGWGASSGCNRPSAEQPAMPPVAVRVAAPVVKDLERRLSYLGTVHAHTEIRVMAQVQGTVRRLPISAGQRVAKGDLVAELEAPDLQAVVERLQADRDYWDQRHAADVRLVAVEALAQEHADASQRARRSARAALAEAAARLAKAHERSPLNGTVLAWEVEPGQHVMPGQPLLLLGDRRAEVRIEVVEEDLERGIEVGTPVTVFARGQAVGRMTVSEVAPVASGRGRTFAVTVPLPEYEAAAWHWGASVAVDFILQSHPNRLAVPSAAVLQQGETTVLFLVRADRALKQAVTTGIEQDGWLEVDFGWNGVDRVALSNLGRLYDDAPVFAVEVQAVRP